jgi:hypothetical protein
MIDDDMDDRTREQIPSLPKQYINLPPLAMSQPSVEKPSKVPTTELWELPDVLLCYLVSFVAAPTHRATVLCHQLAPLCKASRRAILEEDSSITVWDIVLREDYGVSDISTNHASGVTRRTCKRLRRSPVDRVRDAHILIQDNTEIAFFYLSEMVNASKKDLTKSKLCRLLDEYGPHLRINKVLSSGGLYLVEVCRARHVKELVVLKCVQELVERRGALLDLSSNDGGKSNQTALCVAAVRGMPTVVKYLLKRGALRNIRSSGRFRLHTQSQKSLQCKNVTPMEFTLAMRDAEKEAGASEHDLSDLNKCVRLLEDSP